MIKIIVRNMSMKRHKGRVSKVPTINQKMLGDYGIKSLEAGRITTAEISSAIMTMKRKIPAGTSIIPRIYGHLAVSQKPLEVRMGKGKGAIAKRIARVRANTVMFEIGQIKEIVPQEQYIDALRAAASKLSVRTKIVKA